MTYTEEPIQIIESNATDSLRAIRSEGVNLAIWRRERVPLAESAVRALLAVPYAVAIDEKAPDGSRLFGCLHQIIGSRASTASIRSLADDITRLSALFSELAKTIHPRVRLERVEDDGCAIFHADSLKIRLLCTYAGAGTEWLENSNVRRDELGSRGRSIRETNAAIVIDKAKIRRIPAWHVAVFTGRGREGTPALIHRSAPVSTSNDFRLRLCIDLPGDCGC